jgi:hypothetical protein
MKFVSSSINRRATVALMVAFVVTPVSAAADVVLDWNAIALATIRNQNPFAQARFAAIAQLAVFEAVNAITGEYEPYLGTISAPAGASADAAAIAAAHKVLVSYFPTSAPTLDAARVSSLAAIPDGPAKTDGIATGEAAAEAIVSLRANDGSALLALFFPSSSSPGEWQLTPSCTLGGGLFFHWGRVTPFAIPMVEEFRAPAPPDLASAVYARDYEEVRRVGAIDSLERPQDRADVARFYGLTSGSALWNSAARQVAAAQGKSLSHNAWSLALLNIAISDSLVASFEAKYHYRMWRPETAIHDGHLDGNPKTDPDADFAPFIFTPCFPAYPSAHASSAYAAVNVLTPLYDGGGHSVVLANANVPDVTLYYTRFKAIADDIDDARVYGGIHFRFDQEGGARQGKAVAAYILKNTLRRLNVPE